MTLMLLYSITALVMEIQESMLFCDVLIDSTSASESLDQLMHHAEAIVGAMQGLVVIEIETLTF